MSLNIKNDETERLARELAVLTGESLTTAVTVAVRERLDRLGTDRPAPEERAARLMALARDIAPRLKGEFAVRDHGDLLYDDAGLPA
ncbi:type II toxin-antitoxin system VapB family antitoxin [Geodermatophilus chilensis]|jgi:antitoxin VapB|uniref:type II toxin-antitoxin system VapB family antitoxin n=1 Tax=Geodermatophilus chilensis TaxID=2035835 RepID=UPI000C25B587|nr:type II toxin-antitoxin system VapB family antitoxin [Geodermatophilus chilensis]